jgi:DNA-binding response OmpR family regulator
MSHENTPTLLIIEDDDNVCSVIMALLPNQFHVIKAGNGRVGMDLFRRHRPSLVILDLTLPHDLTLPVVQGLEVLEMVRQEVRDQPVIVISGMEGMADVTTALRLGVWGYLPKPFDLAHFRHTVDRAREWLFTMRENRWGTMAVSCNMN